MSICLNVYLFACSLFFCLLGCLSVCLSACLSFYLLACMSLYLLPCLSACTRIRGCLNVYLYLPSCFHPVSLRDCLPVCLYWRRLVKNVGSDKPKYWGEKVVRSDKCMGISQLLGVRVRAAPPQ